MIRPIVLVGFVLSGCADGIADKVVCPECSITMEKVATIGSEEGKASLTGRPDDVDIDGQGRYWVSVLDAFPLIYDSTTAFLQQFGRPGEGPGEFRHVRIRAALPGDSMLISSFPNHHVIGPNLEIARTIRGDPNHQLGQFTLFEWPRESVAMASSFNPTSRTATTYIIRYDLSSDTVIPRDTIMAVQDAGGSSTEYANSLRVIGEPAPDHVWIAHLNRYRLLRLGRQGELQDSIERNLEWFPGGEPIRMGGPDKPTTPRVVNNWVDDRGLLWILVAKPREDTRKAWEGVNYQANETRDASLPAHYRLNETLIEVLDPAERHVVARHIFDGYIIAVLPNNRVAAFVETEEGIPILHIYRLALTGN